MLKQVAVFVENQPGSLRKVTTELHKEGISIYAYTGVRHSPYGCG